MYTPLYIKTDNSLLGSMIKINDLINTAKQYGYEALTITDNTMYGVAEFYDACLQNDIKPIIGLEVILDNNNFVLYAKNNKGYKNLIKLSTINSEINLTINDITKYSSDLICILPYTSKPIYNILNKVYKDFYIGYKNLEELSKLKGHNLIYMNEIIALNKEDLNYMKYLMAIKNNKLETEIEFNKNDCELKQIDYVLKNYNDYLDNNQYIIKNCNVTLEKEKNLLPIYECPNNLASYDYLRKLCKDGLKKRFGEVVNKIYIDRLNRELNVINKMGFCNYFLVVWDYVNFAKKNNIFCHARGSAAGSLVAYVLEITDVDPIKYNLIFERFLNEYRISMPDIDMDFDTDRRSEVIDYCIKKYGEKKVTGIITFTTLKPKLAIRDIGRVLDVDSDKIEYICKLLKDSDNKKNLSLIDNYKLNNKLKDFINHDEELKRLYKIASKVEGLKKNTSSHAAGIVICSKDIDEVIPLEKTSNMYLTAFSMEYLEKLGLLKMDFLGLRNLTLIDNIIKDISQKEQINFNDIPLNDDKAMNIFKTSNTIGIFQFEKAGMRNFLKKLKPNNFEDLFNALALYRPGPMGSIDTYIRRKNGKEQIDYIHPTLEPILKSTYGIIIYQEQIIKLTSTMAGYTLGEADIFRKAVSKKKLDVMEKQIIDFKDKSLRNGYSEEVVNKVSDLIIKFAEYGFNRSHSVAYAILAYKLAYLKAHYSAYFMKNLMSMAIGSSMSTKDYLYECKLNHIEIVSPSINVSFKDYVVDNGKLVYPLSGIKNVGSVVTNAIIEERKNGNFKDIYDFVKRLYGKGINKKNILSLIDAGCFSDFNKHTLNDNIDLIINYGELLQDIEEEFALKPVIEFREEYNKSELMQREYEVFGFYLTNNPITDYKNKYNIEISLKDISYYFNKNIELVLNIKKIRIIKTKKNDDMCFIDLEDETDYISGVIFPKVFANIDIKENDIVKVNGKIEKRYDEYQIIIDNIEVLK